MEKGSILILDHRHPIKGLMSPGSSVEERDTHKEAEEELLNAMVLMIGKSLIDTTNLELFENSTIQWIEGLLAVVECMMTLLEATMAIVVVGATTEAVMFLEVEVNLEEEVDTLLG